MADNKPGQNPPKQTAPAKNAAADTKTPEQKRAGREAKFKELAPKRVRNILKQIEILGNCSNKSGYYYTDVDVEKIFGALGKKLADIKSKFSATGGKETVSFTL